MQKKTVWNIVMLVAIVAVLISGVMIAGSVRGKFDAAKPVEAELSAAVAAPLAQAQNKRGSVNIERSGIAYALSEKDTLKDGDIIETLQGAGISLLFGKSEVCMSENSEAVLHFDESGANITVTHGEVFVTADAENPFTLTVMDAKMTATDAVFSVSAPIGSANVAVFENTLAVGTQNISTGKIMSVLHSETAISDLKIESLSAFQMEHIRKTNAQKSLCFTNEQLDAVTAQREAEQKAAQAAVEQKEQAENAEKQTLAQKRKENQAKMAASASDATKNPTTGAAGTPDAAPQNQCTIEIRCDTILNHMTDLTQGKNQYVPANGVILATSAIPFEEGETAFDVLKRACEIAGIQLEFSWTPALGSNYVEGINQLYEFDCGSESGWMYKVNGWFPNYGPSGYTLKNNDVIVWSYTCKGLGADIGGGV
ncbi:MAG: DUF4430 domain-containing protein [Ruthenibacterium sp.]